MNITMKTALISFALVVFSCFIQHGDAAITAWTTPILGTAGGDGTLSIAEDQGTGATITTYNATTDAFNVTYTLTSAVSPFALGSDGVLTITSSLNYETTQNYTLLIVATDDGGATGTATIAVTVTDVNEFDPVFSAAGYSLCIVDQSPADTTLTTVTATDQDTFDTITYAISIGNTGTDFKIDVNSGLVQVNNAKTLNKTTTASYDLVVTAEDNVATIQTATTTVSVTVADSCSSGMAVAVSMMMLIAPLFVTML